MTNMYDEYYSAYKTATAKYGPKVAIFLMVGIFYEMYDVRNEDGETTTTFLELADLLGLKVVVKKDPDQASMETLTAGIPEFAVHKWAARLTQTGWTVLLIDQVTNPAGKVVRREVVRTLTPGSHVEAAQGLQNDTFLTFVSLEKSKSDEAPLLALTAIDLTTGHLHVYETQAQGSSVAWTCNDVVQFMELYPPKEVLWSSNIDISESKLKAVLGSNQTFHRRSPLTTGAWLKPAFREEYLRTKCGLKSLLPTHVALHVAPGSHVETALVSLLYALEELWPSLKLGTLLVYPWIADSMVHLGENALVQLHMITEASNEHKPDVLSIFNHTATPMGRRGLRNRLLKPSADVETITRNLDAVEDWTKRPSEQGPLVKRLKTMSDMHRLYRKIQQGTITAADMIGLDTTLKAAEFIQIALGIAENQTIRSAISKIFSIDKCYNASEDQTILLSGVNPSLDAIESQIKTKHDAINSWIDVCAKAAGVTPDTFKPEFREKSLIIKGPRAVIQMMSKKLPANTTAVTNKSASYLESSDLDALYGSLLRLRETLKVQQSVVLIEQGSLLADQILVPWTVLTDWITALDVNLTLARVALDMGYVRPTILRSSESSVEIEGLRHPILEAQDRKIPYVQHNVRLGDQQGWLLYGLNASGKSSLMRATGISVLLAQAGSFVPASKMLLSPFSSLHTRIINTDNLWMGLSSFAVEMSEMRDIFRAAGPRSLVLGDELCSGTETTSATALVAAGLRGLLKRGARFLFATHLHGLTRLEEVVTDPRLKIWHLHVEYDRVSDRLIYHRQLREGSGSSLYGLEVAKAMRIPDDILEDAVKFRKRLAGEAELSDSVGSSWNSAIIRRKCEGCGSTESGTLEVHHIKERRMASATGRLQDGSNVHAAANLVVLCDSCHDAVHANKLEIGSLVQTSDGPERSVITASSKQGSKSQKWSEEDLQTIQSVCLKFPTLSPARRSKYLLNQHGIQISSASLRKYC